MGQKVAKVPSIFIDNFEIASLDSVTATRLVGWYHCIGGATKRVRLSIGQRAPLEVECTQLRRDVLESSFGIGDCGFDVAIKPVISANEPIELASVATGRVLYRGTLAGGLTVSEGDARPEMRKTGMARRTSEFTEMLIFDITDFVCYIGWQNNLTGIQRMQSCVILSIINHRMHPNKNIVFISFDKTKNKFIVINNDFVASLLRDMMRPVKNRAIRFNKDDAKAGILPSSAIFDVDQMPSESKAIVVLLGAGWINRSYFPCIAEIKRALNAHFVMMLYDLIPIYATESGDQNTGRVFASFLNGALRLTDRFLSISDYSAKELLRYAEDLGEERPDYVVTQAGSSFHEFMETALPTHAVEGVWGPFALFVGTIEGRKNHRLAFDVWEQLCRDLPDAPLLVCVGRLGWRAEEFVHRLVASNYLKGKILILEDISDAELDWLYSHCLFTLFPSRYEGWGLPVGEALSKGKVCITSRKASLPEVGANSATYVDIDSPQSVYPIVHRLVVDQAWRAQAEQAVVAGYRPISWKDVAERVVQGCLSATEKDPRSLWPPIELGREYSFRDPSLTGPTGNNLSIFNRIKSSRRGILTGEILSDHSLLTAAEIKHGTGWSYAEHWGTWSVYGSAAEIRLSLPEQAAPEVEWYVSLCACGPLDGRLCRVQVGGRPFAEITLTRRPNLYRLGTLRVADLPPGRRVAARFVIEKDVELEASLRAIESRAPCIGFESILFLKSSDYAGRINLIETAILPRLRWDLSRGTDIVSA